MLYLAIDQHRRQLTVNLRDEAGDVILKRQVSTEWKRVREFFEDLRNQSIPQGGFVTIVEVCGFNDWLLNLLAEYGCRQTVLVQPEKRTRHKTDPRDANSLGELLWTNRQRLLVGKKVQNVRHVIPASEGDAQDRQLTIVRQRLTHMRTRTINRAHHLLLKHNLQQECPTKLLKTKAARKWLAKLPLGAIDRLELDKLLDQWELLDKQIGEVETAIGARQAENATARLIATIPGAGAWGSLSLACRIGAIERFPRAGSLPKYWGLTPRSNNSGDNKQRLGSITKEGSSLARCVLGQMVMHVLRHDAVMKQWYMRIKKRRGSRIARVAVMRRLATIIWYMVKRQQPYKLCSTRGDDRLRDACVLPADRNAFFKAQQGRSKEGNEKSCPDTNVAGSPASLTRP
jgi:transposase